MVSDRGITFLHKLIILQFIKNDDSTNKKQKRRLFG